jgi:hypothetical protein
MGFVSTPTAQERVAADKPQALTVARAKTRANIVGALEQARLHLNVIQHNPIAVKRQHTIIRSYEDRLRDFDTTEWLDK